MRRAIETLNKRGIHLYMVVIFAVLAAIIVGLLILKYHVEGEKNLPFNIKQISIISTAQGVHNKGEDDIWYTDLAQQNVLYVQIEKNSNYKQEEIIKKITFNNFKIIEKSELGEIIIYRPSDKDNTYNYSEETIIEETIEYIGSQFTDTQILEINNQGGLIGFSILNKNVGRLTFVENEVIESDGRLLGRAGLKLTDIKFKMSFDIIIETESQRRFKANMVLDLPEGNILEEGVSRKDIETKDIVFKRF